MEHLDIAQQVFDLPAPPRTPEQALTYLQKLLAALPPGEQAGWLSKPDGDNIAALPDGRMVSVSRVMYPGGQIYKVLSDAPNGGPEWVDDGVIDVTLWIRFEPSTTFSTAPPVVQPAPSLLVSPLELTQLHAQLDALKVQADANTEKIQTQIDTVVKNAEKSAKDFAAASAASGLLGKLFGK